MNLVDIIKGLCQDRGLDLRWRGGGKEHGFYQIIRPSGFKSMFPRTDWGGCKAFSAPTEDTVKANILLNEKEVVIKPSLKDKEVIFDLHSEESLAQFIQWLDQLSGKYIPPESPD